MRQWMRENTKDLRGGIPKLPPVIPYVPVAYDADASLDPFSAAKIGADDKARGSGKAGGLQPNFEARELRNSLLEKFPLESMKMIGYLQVKGQPMALIQVDQQVRQVKVGEYMGQDFGIVVQISERETVLKELMQDSAGEWAERTSVMQLQSKEGAGK
ncbi:MAG TPA: pilus assembly protein PilP [Rhodocyclaceae bacterium]|nr:pilus assembly protein PilP [Rhodocyclaceae bacterium]